MPGSTPPPNETSHGGIGGGLGIGEAASQHADAAFPTMVET